MSSFVRTVRTLGVLLLTKPKKEEKVTETQSGENTPLTQEQEKFLEKVRSTFKDKSTTDYVEGRLRNLPRLPGSGILSFARNNEVKKIATNLGIPWSR